VLQERLDDVRVLIDADLVRHGQQQRVGLGDGFVRLELLTEKCSAGGVVPPASHAKSQSKSNTDKGRSEMKAEVDRGAVGTERPTDAQQRQLERGAAAKTEGEIEITAKRIGTMVVTVRPSHRTLQPYQSCGRF